MDLVGWIPVVKPVESRPGVTPSVPTLEIRVTLRCIMCGTCKDFPSQQFSLRPSANGCSGNDADPSLKWRGFAENTSHGVASNVSQHRKCEHCGTLSGVPAAQSDRLRKEVVRALSVDWLEAHAAMNWRSYEDSCKAAETARKQFREGLKATYSFEDAAVANELRSQLATAEAAAEQLKKTIKRLEREAKSAGRRYEADVRRLQKTAPVPANGNGYVGVPTNGHRPEPIAVS